MVSGDTDLAPVVTSCRKLFPTKEIIFAFPFQRRNEELKKLSLKSFMIKPKKYFKHQLPNPVKLHDGKEIHKPPEW